MRNLLRTALILSTLSSSAIVFADGEVKSPPPAAKKPADKPATPPAAADKAKPAPTAPAGDKSKPAPTPKKPVAGAGSNSK